VHRPKAFRVDDRARLDAFVDAHPFAVLVGPGLACSHLPLTRVGDDLLSGHLAAGNEQARMLSPGDRVLAVFSGPHAYVSPRWYATPDAVPTWNYVAVHVQGRIEALDTGAALHAAMREMTARFEPPEVVGDEVIGRMLPGIRGFRIRIDRIYGTFKLSQNRSAADRQGVIDALAIGSAEDRAVAALMRDVRATTDGSRAHGPA
jgi:transcriptional regulator